MIDKYKLSIARWEQDPIRMKKLITKVVHASFRGIVTSAARNNHYYLLSAFTRARLIQRHLNAHRVSMTYHLEFNWGKVVLAECFVRSICVDVDAYKLKPLFPIPSFDIWGPQLSTQCPLVEISHNTVFAQFATMLEEPVQDLAESEDEEESQTSDEDSNEDELNHGMGTPPKKRSRKYL